MPWSSVFMLAAAAAYAGFQWTVHLVVYPQFALVPPEAFAEYERRHQQRISYVVGPLFTVLIVGAGWQLAERPAGTAWALVAALLVATVLGVTAFVAVPLHRRLSAGWDAAAHGALLRADLVRTVAAAALLGTAVLIVLLGPR
jgi:hypothetical protein